MTTILPRDIEASLDRLGIGPFARKSAVAEILGIGISTICKAVCLGQIRRLPARGILDRADLAKWLAQNPAAYVAFDAALRKAGLPTDL